MNGAMSKQLFLLIFLGLFGFSLSLTNPDDTSALRAFHSGITDMSNQLSNWQGDDPCGNGTNWEGVFCAPDANNMYFVIELRLLSHQLSGSLAPDLGNLTQLQILDVIGNDITGSIPPTIGKLQNLQLLLLNGNQLSGTLPVELGNLTKMIRIQIDQNNISGPVPSSFANLISAQHFHMNNNSLNGSIPQELGRLPNLLHMLLDSNKLTGPLPPQLSNISTLLILQLDNNYFDMETIPSQYANSSTLLKLSLRNCGLLGSMPDVSRSPQLAYLDLSNNELNNTIPNSIFSQSFTSIDLSSNSFTGEIPSRLGNLPLLQALILQNNKLNGSISASLVAGKNTSKSGTFLLDLQHNGFSSLDPTINTAPNSAYTLWLSGNPICSAPPSQLFGVCTPNNITTLSTVDTTNEQTSPCQPQACPPAYEIVPALALQSQCICASPISVDYRLKSPGFIFFEPYKQQFYLYISEGLNLTLVQVSVANYSWEPGPRLRMLLQLFSVNPDGSNRSFNLTEMRRLYQTFTGWHIPDNNDFGPYEVLGFTLPPGTDLYPSPGKSSSNLSGGAIAGIVLGCSAASAAIVVAFMYFVFRKYRRPLIRPRKSAGQQEMIKVTSVEYFTFEEMAAATDGFSDSKEIGQGGYGKVYKGVLKDGRVVAIKRAEEGSLQGTKEFHNEIDILSRIHHVNLVPLIGYCNDEGEQMLVYDFVAGGNLQHRLSSKTAPPLDFAARVRIANAAAKGISYLHTEANPPIFHRDIKASNILLDARSVAKVSDFGLSRLAPLPDLAGSTPGPISTMVKGTPGYLDPEYFLTHKLTDKSDVYSFGVVLMELITGMQPISRGKNLVREVYLAYEAGNLLSIIDEHMGAYPSEEMELLLRTALACCRDDPTLRPPMIDVVRDLGRLHQSISPLDQSSASFTVPEKSFSKQDSMTPLSDPYQPSDHYNSSYGGDESALFSRTVHTVAPR